MAFTNPYLSGNFAPVADETTITGLPVEGALPVGLDGRYVRIGPNPAGRTDEPYHGGPTDVMVHAVELRNGRVVAYRNRWILTPHVTGILGLGPRWADVESCGRLVIRDRRLFAAGTAGVAYELGAGLTSTPVRGTGHPPAAAPSDGCSGAADDDHAHHSVAVAVGAGWVRSLRTLPGNGGLVLETRTATPNARTIEVVDRRPQGWVTIGDRPRGGTVRYAYTVAFDDDRPFAATVAYKHDLADRSQIAVDFGGDRHPGELIFVPDGGRRTDADGGWLMGFVHDDASTTDDFVVLDAQALGGGPVASVRLPRRVPYGWHGIWQPL